MLAPVLIAGAAAVGLPTVPTSVDASSCEGTFYANAFEAYRAGYSRMNIYVGLSYHRAECDEEKLDVIDELLATRLAAFTTQVDRDCITMAYQEGLLDGTTERVSRERARCDAGGRGCIPQLSYARYVAAVFRAMYVALRDKTLFDEGLALRFFSDNEERPTLCETDPSGLAWQQCADTIEHTFCKPGLRPNVCGLRTEAVRSLLVEEVCGVAGSGSVPRLPR